MRICGRILSDRATFDKEEIEYKLVIAERIRAVFDAVEVDEDLIPLLKKAFASPNNLLTFYTYTDFLDWVDANRATAREALRTLSEERNSVEERIDGFLAPVRGGHLHGPGVRLSLASFLLMGLDPAEHPMYRTRDYRTVERLLGWPDVPAGASPGETYAHHRAFAWRLLDELRGAGLDARDLLDAQSLIWILANGDDADIRAWRGDPAADEPWWKPLEHPPGIEEELQALLGAGAPAGTGETLGAIFRRAILLHQRVGTDGFLSARGGNPRRFSVTVGTLFACAATRASVLNLLVDRELGEVAGYEVSPSPLTDDELGWLTVDLELTKLTALLEKEGAWTAYERMLERFPGFSRAQSNHKNVGKMSVLTGERFGKGDELADLVKRFREDRGYPTDKDRKNLAAREEFAGYLSPEAVEDMEWEKFVLVFSSSKYGYPGPAAGLVRYIRGSDAEGLERLRRSVEHLLYADLPLGRRLDDLIGGEFRVANFGEAVATKLLSICYPDLVLPIFVVGGEKGKAVLMRHRALGLEVPEEGSRGELAMGTNDLLRDRLAPHFGEDTNAMKEFLYWLHAQEEEEETTHELNTLAHLADELLVKETFLVEVLELLHDRKQIIFYGPPGTGKTYLARKLVEHLAGGVGLHEVVQFHPSYSYEDFVQGYRPVSREDGVLSYELKPGPLMRLARRALESGRDHVLLIDEINRGNLPKILGELLYLLEYRDDEVALMYGEEGERFAMPENLYVIGTMNTADRSIALVDAALRRRFHFVPLFPNETPVKGLLRRWLERHRPGMVDVAYTVDALNDRLRERFGPHLQIGPSYFMKGNLSEEVLRRVWDYDIMPFLEDQLFGHEEELSDFELGTLRREGSGHDTAEGVPSDPGLPDA